MSPALSDKQHINSATTNTQKAKVVSDAIAETTEYDPNTKVSRIIRHRNNTLLDMVEKDAQGRLKRTEYDATGNVRLITEVNEKKQLERMTLFSSKGIFKHVYAFEYDQNGYLIKQRSGFLIPALPCVVEWWRKPARYTYFSKRGRAVSFEEGREPDVNEFEGVTKGMFANGKIVRVIAYDFMDHPRHIKHYSNGVLIQESIRELRGSLALRRRYETQQEGDFTVKTMLEQRFDIKEKCIGQTLVKTRLDDSNKPQLTQVYTDGVLSKRVIYSLGNKKVPGEKIERDYNKQEQCVEERFLTMSDQLLEAIRYEYDASGMCSDSYKWNGKGWFSERTPGKKAPENLSAPPVASKTSERLLKVCERV